MEITESIMKKTFLFLAVSVLIFTAPALAGNVTGKVSFTGTPPTPQKIDMAADPVCAGQNANGLTTEDVIVNADGTLQNVFVYVKEGLEGKTFDVPQQPAVLDQKGCHYTPHVFGLQVGQPLQILNSDSTLHNVHGLPKKSKEFNLGMPLQGMKLNRKFDAPEIMVKFKCDVHPWMSAYAGVVPHPFYAVTGEAGSFEIKDLPPGNYVLEAWHEKYGTQTQSVTVDEAGPKTVDFSFAA
jgi:plastocyanin